MNYSDLKSQLVNWIRAWFAENGPDCCAVVGVSGGKDSTVVAALCVEALGKERVVGVLMPNGIQSDIADAVLVADTLGIRYTTVNIAEACSAIGNQIKGLQFCDSDREYHFSDLAFSSQARTNLAPRIRMATLYAVSQSVHGRVANTSNLSERWIGWSTRYGDSVGDFSPLYNLTSDEVVGVGLLCGLPEWLIIKAPSDGLTGSTDEENFGFTYNQLNDYIRNGSCDPAVVDAIDSRHRKNMFKSMPMSTFETNYIKNAL